MNKIILLFTTCFCISFYSFSQKLQSNFKYFSTTDIHDSLLLQKDTLFFYADKNNHFAAEKDGKGKSFIIFNTAFNHMEFQYNVLLDTSEVFNLNGEKEHDAVIIRPQGAVLFDAILNNEKLMLRNKEHENYPPFKFNIAFLKGRLRLIKIK